MGSMTTWKRCDGCSLTRETASGELPDGWFGIYDPGTDGDEESGAALDVCSPRCGERIFARMQTPARTDGPR